MYDRHWIFELALAALCVAPAASATECSFIEWTNFTYPANYTGYRQSNRTYSITIYSQEELDRRAAGCTTLVGDLYIAGNWTGPLLLQNITNITKIITTESSNTSSANYKENQITSIEMPDLVSVGSIYLTNAQPIQLVSFPKLESLEKVLQITASPVAPNLNFPALVNASQIFIEGNTTSMNFDSLRNVSEYLSISSSYADGWSTAAYRDSPPRAFSFPSLRSAGALSLVGNITSVNLPLLESMAPPLRFSWSESGFNIANSGKMLNFTVPRLWNTTVLRLSGGIGTFSFPSLINLDGDLIVTTGVQMNISILPLKTAANIILSGNFTGYDFSSLKNLRYKLSIHTTLSSLDCSQAQYIWGNISHDQPITKNLSPNDAETYLCSATTPYVYKSKTTKKSLSETAKIGLGLGLGLTSVILICLWNCRREQKNAEKMKLLPPPAYEVELEHTVRRQSTDAEGEILPGYQPRGAPGVVVVEDGGPPVGGRVAEPPGYDSPAHAHEVLSTPGEEPAGRISATLRRDEARRE